MATEAAASELLMVEDPATNVYRTWHTRQPLGILDRSEVGPALEAFPGVAAVSMQRYSIAITKGELFSWDEVAPRVTAFLRGYLGLDTPTESDDPKADRMQCEKQEARERWLKENPGAGL